MNWIKASEFAELYGLSTWTVNRMCRDKQLKAKKMGRFWYVSRSEL